MRVTKWSVKDNIVYWEFCFCWTHRTVFDFRPNLKGFIVSASSDYCLWMRSRTETSLRNISLNGFGFKSSSIWSSFSTFSQDFPLIFPSSAHPQLGFSGHRPRHGGPWHRAAGGGAFRLGGAGRRWWRRAKPWIDGVDPGANVALRCAQGGDEEKDDGFIWIYDIYDGVFLWL